MSNKSRFKHGQTFVEVWHVSLVEDEGRQVRDAVPLRACAVVDLDQGDAQPVAVVVHGLQRVEGPDGLQVVLVV